MIRKVELRKCGGLDDKVIGLHGHLWINDQEVSMIRSRAQLAAELEENARAGHIAPEERAMVRKVLEEAQWLPEQPAGDTLMDLNLNLDGSEGSVRRACEKVFAFFEGEIAPQMRIAQRRQEGAYRRLCEHLKSPPTVLFYKAINGNEVFGWVVCGGMSALVFSKIGLYEVIKAIVGSGFAKVEDFESIHAAATEAELPYNRVGQLPEGFTKFDLMEESQGGDGMGRLVDAQGKYVLELEQLPLIQSLTGNGMQFTPDKIQDLLRDITGSGLPMRSKSEERHVDLRDGYKATLTYVGGQLVSASATYEPPQATEQKVEGAEVAPLPAGDGHRLVDAGQDIEQALGGEEPPAGSPERDRCLEAAST